MAAAILSVVHGYGDTASKPAAGDVPVGSLYFDTDLETLERSNGTTWETYAPAGGGGGGVPTDGWIALGETLAYGSADDPTYTATCAGVDLTDTLSLGMRIRVSQSTGGTKYFIITKIAFSTNTTITLYGGTDYDLNNEAISSPYYSPVKAPYGFPLDPAKWTVQTTDTTERTQASPVQNTWYNLGSVSLSIPIGVWNVTKDVDAYVSRASANTVEVQTTLSTANNSESDTHFTSHTLSGAVVLVGGSHVRSKVVALTSKTTHYLNTRTPLASMSSIYNLNATVPAIIRAVCAYL